MAKGGHKTISPSRIEAMHFLKYLAACELPRRSIGGLLGGDPSERERTRLRLVEDCFEVISKRIMHGTRRGKRKIDPFLPIKIEIPNRLVSFISDLVQPRGGLFGLRQDMRRADWDANPLAWRFAHRCRLAHLARRGRPNLTAGQISERLDRQGEFSERHMYRLMERQAAKAKVSTALLGILENGAAKPTDFRSV